MPYVYMVECSDGSYYTGWAVDLEARIKAHNGGRGARYTRSRLPVKLVYWEPQPDRSRAQRREACIRVLSRPQKELLVKQFANNNHTTFAGRSCVRMQNPEFDRHCL